jgi:hypothetical protein
MARKSRSHKNPGGKNPGLTGDFGFSRKTWNGKTEITGQTGIFPGGVTWIFLPFIRG